jgi:hypothetical protein
MFNPQNIKLGNEVKDAATGFTGTASGFLTHLGGMTHICIQPKCKEDGIMLKAEEIDIHLVDFVSHGIADRAYQADANVPDLLGHTVIDNITKFIGKAVVRFDSLHGCTSYGIAAEAGFNADTGAQTRGPGDFVDYRRLSLVTEFVDPEEAGTDEQKADDHVDIPQSNTGCIRSPMSFHNR